MTLNGQAKKLMRIFAIFFLLSCNIACDQVSKKIIRRHFAYDEQLSFLNDHFIITKIENSGAFLSLGDSLPSPLRILLLIIFPIVLLGSVLFYLLVKTQTPKLNVLAICFMVGGGLGNLYDRILYGSVTDFLFLDFGIIRTGVFNMGDVSITTGMCLLLLQLYWESKQELA